MNGIMSAANAARAAQKFATRNKTGKITKKESIQIGEESSNPLHVEKSLPKNNQTSSSVSAFDSLPVDVLTPEQHAVPTAEASAEAPESAAPPSLTSIIPSALMPSSAVESTPVSFDTKNSVIQTTMTYWEDIDSGNASIVDVESKVVKPNRNIEGINSIYKVQDGKVVQVNDAEKIIENVINGDKIKKDISPEINEEIQKRQEEKQKLQQNKGSVLTQLQGMKPLRRTQSAQLGGGKMRRTRKARRNVSRKRNKKSHNKTR